ncbi:hypothetical protein J5N97_000569 [Dioscorea zingiberensis]|uniref:STAS domain-containing protein n=1 Tax=Dioscorea zingiberensis TaxID=325984 RepID=A0A9D5H1G0_9LILI|nr:hypothetical protein J5N97_000569 [Dioscorea zingiberensis]
MGVSSNKVESLPNTTPYLESDTSNINPNNTASRDPHKVSLPPNKTTFQSIKQRLGEVFFPDDPLHQFKDQSPFKKLILHSNTCFPSFSGDLITPSSFSSLMLSQGISYAKLANLPPIIGLLGMANNLMGFSFLVLLLLARHIIGHLEKGLNPPSANLLYFSGSYLSLAIKTGIITGILALTEGIAVGRTFASSEELSGSFSRSAVNYNAGAQTAVSNIVMASAVMFTMLFLMPLFYYTPNVILSAIIISAVIGLIDFQTALKLWKVDKLDFLACMCAFFGVLFISVQMGLLIAVGISMFRILLQVTRPNTVILGNIPGTQSYRNMGQYREARRVPSFLILSIESPIYFTNCMYLQERIMRWVREEEERTIRLKECTLKCIVLDMAAVTAVDTSGMEALSELKKALDKRSLQLVLANPVGDVIEKLSTDLRKPGNSFGSDSIYMNVEEAVAAVSSL